MARIDRFIRELHGSDGERLIVSAGRPVVVAAGDTEATLTSAEPNSTQVKGLLDEILPDDEGTAEADEFAFRYDAPTGPVDVHAHLTESASRIEVVPASGDGDGAAPEHAASGPERAAPPADASGAAAGAAGAADAAPAPEAEVDRELAAGTRPPAGPSTGDGPDIDRLFRKMVERGCSDLHVSAASPPLFRKDGEIVDLDESRLSPEETREMLLEITPERNREEFDERNDTDFAYELEGVARFRCNLFRDRKGVGGVFRQIPADIMTAEDLGLPESILDLCELNKGLVVVTGPTGSGKSTTLAAMIDYINEHQKAHVITIEDPIEFVHDNKRCLINQREIGVHTEGFKVALRAALREDPDIVLVGEMRDLETVEIALETAETGHLVFGTLHTNTAASTVDRIIDQFPADQQNQIRTMLSESLKGVIAQTLCRRKEGGRVAAMEILLVTNAVSNLIREGKTFQIPSLMQTGKGAGMRTLNDALIQLVRDGTVTAKVAHRNAVEKTEFRQLLERHGMGLNR